MAAGGTLTHCLVDTASPSAGDWMGTMAVYAELRGFVLAPRARLAPCTPSRAKGWSGANLRDVCIRQGGCWHPDNLVGGYCEHKS